MRVALVDPLSTTPPYDASLAAALARRGHDVHLLAAPFPFGAVPEPDGYRREELFLPVSGRLFRRAPRARARLALKALEYGPSVWRLLRRIESLAPEVVHFQWLPLPRFDRRWLQVAAARRTTVLTAHHVLPRKNGRELEARTRVYETVDRIVVHSHRAVADLAGLGIAADRVDRIAHPVFEPANGRPLEPPVGQTILFLGLLRAYKGVDVLLRALAEIAESVPDVRLVVAGDPVDPVEPLRDLAAAVGVADRVDWRLRFLGAEEMADALDEAAFVVLPYRQTDASGVLATAIGHGRPAVVSDVGSVGETVTEFGAGFAVPPGDAGALAAACTRLLTDPFSLAEAAAGAHAARAALSWDRAAEAHERAYAAALAGRPARR